MSQMFGLHQRHTRLFILLCFFPVMSFSVIHYLQENYYLSLILLITACFFAVNFTRLKRTEITLKSRIGIIFAMWSCLAVAIYYVGVYGFLYVFPTLIGVFFLLPVRASLLLSIPSALIFLVLVHLYGETMLAIKLFAPIVLTVIFTAFFAYYSKYQQLAIGEESKKDPLTRMANRHAFNEWLNQCRARDEIISITSIHFNIDNFRIINDTYGFTLGDKVIQQVAKELTKVLNRYFNLNHPSSHFIARFSGDIFTVGLTNLPTQYNLLPLVNLCKEAVHNLNVIPESVLSLTTSVSIVSTTRTDGEFINAIESIDAALRYDKKLGKNSLQIFDESNEAQLQDQKYIALELHQALSKGQFYLTFMPIYHGESKAIIGAELLIRSHREELARIGPDKFIPIAESCGLIDQIDYWVIQESFKIIATNEILKLPQIEFYSINISSHQLRNKNFVSFISQQLIENQIDPKLIELELTETSLIETDLQAIETLVLLKRLGLKLSLDDFGTGFTSFNQLKKYPLDCLKIDRSFVSGDKDNLTPLAGMSDVILSIAKLYKFKVIAEGVETLEQFQKLKVSGCHYFQGYLFSKPLKLKDFVYLLSQPEN